MKHSRSLGTAALLGAAGLILSGCAGAGAPAAAPSADAATTVDSAEPRLAITYDGGIAVVDAATLETVGELPIEGFTRVNPAGDGRHVMVTVPAGFQVLDTGVWTSDGTSYAADPVLTDDVFEADAAGHVVVHGGRTVLFADGTGEITAFDTDALLTADGLPDTDVSRTAEAHHGVAVELEDGSMFATIGTEEARTGAYVVAADGTETARNEQCPGVHGEGSAKDEVIVVGCQDGALVYDGAFTKIASPDAFGRIGNVAVTDSSSIAFADYRDDPDAEGYLLHRVAFIDTAAKTLDVVDLPAGVEYTFRGLARGPADEAVLLGTDGALHVFDETTGELTDSISVIDAWDGPAEWQDPHPAVKVLDGIAYVTDPAANSVHAVDLETGAIVTTGELPGTPNEIAIVTG